MIPLSLRKAGTLDALRACVTLVFAVSAFAPLSHAVIQTDVFVSGEDGYHTFRIPAIVRASDKALLAFAEGRKSDAGDAGNIDLVLKRSTDDGKSWGALQVIWDDGENTCGNPCPVLDEITGTIWLTMTHNLGTDREVDIINKRSKGTRTPWVTRSEDGGKTWAKPVSLVNSVKDPSWGWYATGPGIGIQLKHGVHAGRLVIPCVHSYDDPKGELRGGPFEYGSHVFYSDDHGKSWKLGGVVRPRTNECQVVELDEPDGKLLLNMRSYFGHHCRAESTSIDGGETWTPPHDKPELIEPRAQASIVRHSWGDDKRRGLLLFSNPAHREKRVRMTVRVSADDGKTWSRSLVLHEAFSAYSSLVPLSPAEAGCLYERGDSVDNRRYERITFARFSLNETKATR